MRKQWNFPTYDEMAKDVANRVISEYKVNGKTMEEWIEILSDYLKDHEEKSVPHDV